MNIGNGKNVYIRIYPYIGDNGSYELPVETLEHLEEIGLNTHNQIQRPWSPIIKGGYWFKSRYIRLFGKWDSLWDNYIKSFKSAGISMGDSEDKIVWVWNKKS